MAISSRGLAVVLCGPAMAAALAACGGSDNTPKASAPAASSTSSTSSATGSQPAPSASATGQTFGTQPCGKVLSFEEIAAATGASPTVIDVVADGQCDYQDNAGSGVMTVLLESDSAGHLSCTSPDGTYLGKPVEQVPGIGDTAVWSPSAESLCFVKGTNRVRLSLSTSVADPKAVTAGLAAKAVQRLP